MLRKSYPSLLKRKQTNLHSFSEWQLRCNEPIHTIFYSQLSMSIIHDYISPIVAHYLRADLRILICQFLVLYMETMWVWGFSQPALFLSTLKAPCLYEWSTDTAHPYNCNIYFLKLLTGTTSMVKASMQLYMCQKLNLVNVQPCACLFNTADISWIQHKHRHTEA